MTGGKANGHNRQYQVECRDVLTFRNPELTPWAADGIDVPFELPDTCWTFDVALGDRAGALVVAECRRKIGAVKQEDLAAFAYKVEVLRKALDIPVGGVFIAKKDHQIGAIKVAQFNGIQVAILRRRNSTGVQHYVLALRRGTRKAVPRYSHACAARFVHIDGLSCYANSH